MAQAIDLNSLNKVSTVAQQEKPCYTELFERIQAIWNVVCAWICDLARRLLSGDQKALPQESRNLAERCFNAFRHMTKFLEPIELIQCEAVCKSWKDERLWQAQCANYGITVAPTSGRWKDRFKVPDIAFGPREWRKHFGKVGPMPPLPVNIKSQVAEFGKTHVLTLIPKTVNGQPLSFNSFAPLAEKAGMKLSIMKRVADTFGNEAVDKPLWVWMEQKLKEGSRGKTQAQAEQDYPGQLGQALYYTISIVAHYARHKICLFPKTPQRTYAHTCDGVVDQWGVSFVLVGGSAPGVLHVFSPNHLFDFGVASLVPAEVLGIGT